MIKKLLLLVFVFFLFIVDLKAAPIAGGQVTYRSLGNYRFEITYKVYRDCRGIPLNVNSYMIRCASSGTSKTLSAVRVNISEITLLCPTTSPICNPQNQTISSTSPGFEEHVYMDTLDFNGSESAFKSCCIIQIGAGACCRNGAITTGASGNDFWVYSTLDLCKAPSNSSPVFAFKPTWLFGVNSPLIRSYAAKDTIDNDSLSYSFTDPKQSWTSKTSWSGGYDSKNPFTPYYPSGYDKSKGPGPDANPAIGIYLDSFTGTLIAHPTNGSQTSVMAISVKEWRKDSTGKYNQIGEIIIDHQIICITMPYNNLPTISAKTNYAICEGQPFTLDLPSDDKVYVPAPPAKIPPPDSVTLSWDKGIRNATYSIINPKLRLPVGKFEWTPATGDSKKPPFSFSIIAMDNACPYRGMIVKTIQFTVFPKINVSSSVHKINANTYSTGINISNRNYSYTSGKYFTSTTKEDIRNYYFKSSKNTYSISENDTIVFKKNGTYIINQTFLSPAECNNALLKDTIIVSNILEVTLGMTSKGVYTDTAVCQNSSTRTFAKVTNAKRPVTYNWKTGALTKSDTLGYFDHSFYDSDTLFLSVKDADGKTNSTFRMVNVLEIPEIYAGKDMTVCPGSIVKLKAQNKRSDKLTWTWAKDNTAIGSSDSILVLASGDYVVSGTNKNGCIIFDTLNLKHFAPVPIDLISGLFCQSKNSINQAEIFSGDPNKKFVKIDWKLLKTLPMPMGGNNLLPDLLIDRNTGPVFDFRISFDNSKILFPSLRDSLIVSATAIDFNACKSEDTMTLSIIKTPEISISKSLINYCSNQSFNLDSFGRTSSQHKWVPLSRNGFGHWPSYAPFNGYIAPLYFKQAANYKAKIEANNEFCIKTDSLIFNIQPLLMPVIEMYEYNTAIKFRDKTLNVQSRKWYIDNVFITSADTMTINKLLVNFHPVKLEVFGANGCENDTTVIPNTRIGINQLIRSEIQLFPNPANDILILKQADNWKPSEYEIYDVLGQKMAGGITKNKEEKIDIKNMDPGIYYLKYKINEGVISLRFIKSE